MWLVALLDRYVFQGSEKKRMATSSKQQHWLMGVAGRAGLGDLRDIRIRLDISPAQAWEKAATALDISQEELARHVAETFGMKVADLESAEPTASSILPEADAQRLLVLPLRATDRTLTLATADPLAVDAEQEISFIAGRDTEFEISPPNPLSEAINGAYRAGEANGFVVTSDDLQEAVHQVKFAHMPELSQEQDLEAKEWAMVELTSLILVEAVNAEAELVMIGPMESGGRVRFQVNGELQTFIRMPRKTLSRITNRIKDLANVEESEEAESSDTRTGEIQAQIGDLDYLVRISTTPEGDCDKMVMWLTEAGTPAAADEGETVPSTVPAPVAPAADTAPEAPLALVVDDEPPDLMLMGAIMERLGFDVVEAVDGEEALRHLDGDEDFAVMLLDLNMPGMDGLEILDHVRGTLKTAALPVVILTGSEDPDDQIRLLAAGADDYIKKPIDPSRAVNRVQAVLRRAES